jgi:hypothetical protein
VCPSHDIQTLAVTVKYDGQKESRYESLHGMLERFGSSVITDLILRNSTYAWGVMVQSLMVVGDGVPTRLLFKQHPRGGCLLIIKKKDSNEFKMFSNVYTAGHYNYKMEVVNFDYLSDISSSDVPTRDRGRLDKVINYRSNERFARHNQELSVMLGLEEEERLELVATVREQEKALMAPSLSRRDMDYLKMKAAALEEKNTTAADK